MTLGAGKDYAEHKILVRKKKDKVDPIKTENFCSSKDCIKRRDSYSECFSNGFIFRIYKEFFDIIKKII